MISFLKANVTEVKWIKIATGIFDDEKIRLIEAMPDADSLLVLWFKLLVQAGRANLGGRVCLSEDIPYTDEMLATLFSRPLNVIRLALRRALPLSGRSTLRLERGRLRVPEGGDCEPD